MAWKAGEENWFCAENRTGDPYISDIEEVPQ